MKRKHRIGWTVIALIGVPVVGYLIAHGLTLVFPFETSHVLNGLFTLFLVLLLLAVPYYMIKLLGHAAHLRNPQERELHLRDLPKDKDQLEQSPR